MSSVARLAVTRAPQLKSKSAYLVSTPPALVSSSRLSYNAPKRNRIVQVRAADSSDEAISAMMAEAVKRVNEDPAQKEQLRQMMEQMQAEMEKNPEEFKEKLKRQQELQQLQMRTFLGQVSQLSPEDPDVGHVVKELQAEGEVAFQKYITDQPLLETLQMKVMTQAVVKELMQVDPEDPELGAARRQLDEEGESAVASFVNDAELMKKITLRAVLNDPYSLHGAVRLGDVDTMKYLIDSGKDVNAPGSADLNNASPLHIACATGNTATAALLIERGAEINMATPDTMGNSPLHFAAGYGHLEMVNFMLEKGANKYGTNGNGQAPSEMTELLGEDPVVGEIRAALS
eukprot:CAMPEP_0196584558 /NCGR_PEP_ID=MMETSP1081-20130531/47555_1 /TAXON_ID=36882 /ORGANISM="Pyramimonas amylifera, Strain CCMP720" /LENGTH=344 /DNA_ID=CAMNT_0041905803 /DNA_START=116 /DNA_END=1150 /DNA_ORIENTATION=+